MSKDGTGTGTVINSYGSQNWQKVWSSLSVTTRVRLSLTPAIYFPFVSRALVVTLPPVSVALHGGAPSVAVKKCNSILLRELTGAQEKMIDEKT